MTNGREPSNTPVPDSGGESDRRKWTHKRAQFDTAINTARLLGVVQNIAMGNMAAGEALRIILEVNSATDQAQYVAEMLAMKKEFRELARLDFIPEIAKFIRDGSRLVPSLTEGLASQMLMAMGHAAQNDAYLETVSSAVSTLLSDLDRPLMTDARNYLRLLWDQMEATRKLKQTEARYTGLGESPSPAPLVNPPSVPGIRKSTMIGVGDARPPPQSVPRQKIAEVGASAERPSSPSVRRQQTGEVGASTTNVEWPATPVVPRHKIAEASDSASKVVVSAPEPAAQAPSQKDTLEAESPADEFDAVTQQREALRPDDLAPLATPKESSPDTQPLDKWFDAEPDAPKHDEAVAEFKLPTKGVPRWAVAAVLVTALAGAGVVIMLISEPEPKSTSPANSASGSSKSPQSSAAPSAVPSTRLAKPRKPPPAALPPSAPPAPVASQPPIVASPPPSQPAPKVHEPAAAAVAQPKVSRVPIEAPAPRPAKPAKVVPDAKPPATPERRVEPAPKSTASPVVTPPDVSKTLSPLDRIVAELRLISPDPVGIEDKARELARIIARSKRKEATQIIDNLGPPIAVDPLGRDPTLEDSLQTFAVSVLGRVATDDDDNRAVDALLMLGEWVKNGGKGKQKALSALQTLSHESVIKTSAPRLRALKTAQAQAD